MSDGTRGGPHLDGFTDPVEIGRGGFGTVYRAIDTELGRPVAIKVLATTLEGSALTRFRREAVTMSSLSGHPNVVALYSTGVTGDGRPFLVMPYLPAGSFRDRVLAGPLPWDEVARIGIRLAGALESAHRLGVLHRDIKPDNVLCSDFGEPLLGDFGIARMDGEFETVSRHVTASIGYAAPEVLDGQAPTVASDVYSLGATLHHLLGGRPAFATKPDEALVALYVRISRDPPPDLSPSGAPASMLAAIERAMAKRPEERQPSAEAVGASLQAAERAAGRAPTTMAISPSIVASRNTTIDGEAPLDLTRTSSPATRAATPSVHKRRATTIAAAVVLAAAVGAGAWLIGHSGSSTSTGSTTTTTTTPPVTIVDATPAGTPLSLGDAATHVTVHAPAGGAAQVRIKATAGQRVMGRVSLAAKPTSPVPVALTFNGSPAESKDIVDTGVDIGPVALDDTGTWVLQIGPASAAVDGSVDIGLAPPDLKLDAKIGTAVEVDITRSRQRALVSFAGRAGTKVNARWTWTGTDPRSTSLALLAPNGSALATWNAEADGTSKVVTLPTDGTYVVGLSIDSDGTGAGSVIIISA